MGEDTVPATNIKPAKVTKQTILQSAITRLGPIFKEDDMQVMIDIVNFVVDQAIQIANMSDTPIDRAMRELKAEMIQGSVIAYENRGVENQTRQDELGQQNHFHDTLLYLQKAIIIAGKRYVI